MVIPCMSVDEPNRVPVPALVDVAHELNDPSTPHLRHSFPTRGDSVPPTRPSPRRQLCKGGAQHGSGENPPDSTSNGGVRLLLCCLLVCARVGVCLCDRAVLDCVR